MCVCVGGLWGFNWSVYEFTVVDYVVYLYMLVVAAGHYGIFQRNMRDVNINVTHWLVKAVMD